MSRPTLSLNEITDIINRYPQPTLAHTSMARFVSECISFDDRVADDEVLYCHRYDRPLSEYGFTPEDCVRLCARAASHYNRTLNAVSLHVFQYTNPSLEDLYQYLLQHSTMPRHHS